MKRVAIFVASLLLLLAAPTPAQAWPVPPVMAPCVDQPYFSEMNWDSSAKRLVLAGLAYQCGPTVANGAFRLATYTADHELGVAQGYNIRRFWAPEEGEIRFFGAVVVPNTPGQYGFCLLATDSHERILCGLASVSAPSDRPPHAAISPLPVDDPLVNREAILMFDTGTASPPPIKGGPGGNCGTCF